MARIADVQLRAVRCASARPGLGLAIAQDVENLDLGNARAGGMVASLVWQGVHDALAEHAAFGAHLDAFGDVEAAIPEHVQFDRVVEDPVLGPCSAGREAREQHACRT